MKVVLNQTLPKVGKAGQVVNVADGFARNFLFPRGMATLADKAMVAQLARQDAKTAAEAEKTRGAAEKDSEKLQGKTITIKGKTAKGSVKLFGAITSADIADAIKEQLGVTLDKKSVPLLHPIKRIGTHEILIDLHRDVDAKITLALTDEDGNLGIEVVEAPKVEETTEEPVAETPVVEAPAEKVEQEAEPATVE